RRFSGYAPARIPRRLRDRGPPTNRGGAECGRSTCCITEEWRATTQPFWGKQRKRRYPDHVSRPRWLAVVRQGCKRNRDRTTALYVGPGRTEDQYRRPAP